MDNVYNQSLSKIAFANSVVKQNKAWLNRSGISEKVSQQRANTNHIINTMAEQQSSTTWGKKTKNKEYLRLRIDSFEMMGEGAKSE